MTDPLDMPAFARCPALFIAAIFHDGGLTAGYLHLYFPSNPAAVAAIFKGR